MTRCEAMFVGIRCDLDVVQSLRVGIGRDETERPSGVATTPFPRDDAVADVHQHVTR